MDATLLIPFPRQLSKHCIMRDVLSSGGKKGGMENGKDFIRGEEDGAATWRIGARLNQQPSTFNPLQEVYKYVQLFWSNFVPGTVNRGAFLSFPHRLSGGYDFVGRGGGGILILLFASGQASQKGSDSSSEGGFPAMRWMK